MIRIATPGALLAVLGVLVLWASAEAQRPYVQHHLYTFYGDSAFDIYGWSVAAAGDVNRDDYADVIVGAFHDDNNGSNSGSAQVLSGRDGTVIYGFNGDSAGDVFGYYVNGAGDVDKDGWPDVIVGAFGDDNTGNQAGSARVFSGRTGTALYTFYGAAPGDIFGLAVDGAGDVNNDGYDDLIVGASFHDKNGSDSGMARVFSGKDGAILYTFYGDSAGDFFGDATAGAGDVNNDGYPDVIVGAYKDDNNGEDSGMARVFSGRDGSILYTFNGDSPGDFLGWPVNPAGDVNLDGYDDVIVGSRMDDNTGANAGSARVLSGKDGAVLYLWNGDSAGDQLGYFVDGAGDLNGDGYPDLVVGAPYDDDRGTNSGGVRLFSGKDGAVLFTFYGDSATDRFGNWVSGAGDVNKDGYADVIVGAFQDDNNGVDSGSARVLSGKRLEDIRNVYEWHEDKP